MDFRGPSYYTFLSILGVWGLGVIIILVVGWGRGGGWGAYGCGVTIYGVGS